MHARFSYTNTFTLHLDDACARKGILFSYVIYHIFIYSYNYMSVYYCDKLGKCLPGVIIEYQLNAWASKKMFLCNFVEPLLEQPHENLL